MPQVTLHRWSAIATHAALTGQHANDVMLKQPLLFRLASLNGDLFCLEIPNMPHAMPLLAYLQMTGLYYWGENQNRHLYIDLL